MSDAEQDRLWRLLDEIHAEQRNIITEQNAAKVDRATMAVKFDALNDRLTKARVGNQYSPIEMLEVSAADHATARRWARSWAFRLGLIIPAVTLFITMRDEIASYWHFITKGDGK